MTLSFAAQPVFKKGKLTMKRKIAFILTTALILISVLTISIAASAPDEGVALTAENLFSLIYDTVLRYSAEIFSFLSLIGTVVISYLYKKGLLPSVKTALSTLGNTVGKIKESNDMQCIEQKNNSERVDERLTRFEESLKEYGKSLEELKEHLICEEEMKKQRMRTDKILSSQIDMLYDIFMTSSIPHYQKEATGDRINKMRKEMESYEEEA